MAAVAMTKAKPKNALRPFIFVLLFLFLCAAEQTNHDDKGNRSHPPRDTITRPNQIAIAVKEAKSRKRIPILQRAKKSPSRTARERLEVRDGKLRSHKHLCGDSHDDRDAACLCSVTN